MENKITCSWHSYKPMVIVTIPLPTLCGPISPIIADRNHNLSPTDEGVKKLLHNYIDSLDIKFKEEGESE